MREEDVEARPEASRAVDRIAVALAVALLVVLWMIDYLPTNDGPHHVLLGHLENHFDDPAQRYADFLERGRPITTIGFHIVFSTLESLMPWRTALRLALSVILLAWAGGVYALARAVNPGRSAVGLLGFGAAFHWDLYMGFFSFVFATGLSFLTLALAIRHDPWERVHRLVLGVLLFLVAVVHLFAAILLGVALVLVVALRTPRGRWIRELGLLAIMAVPAAALAAFVVLGAAEGGQLASSRQLVFGERIALWPRFFLGGPAWRTLPYVGLAAAGLGLAIARFRKLEGGERGILVTAGAAAVASVVTPFHLSGWEFFSTRFAPIAAVGGLCLLPIEQLDAGRRRLATIGLAAVAVLGLGWAALYNLELRRASDDALAGLDAPIERVGPRFAVVLSANPGQPEDPFERAIPSAAPLFQLGLLYATAQGGIPPYFFSSRADLHAFVFHPEGRALYPAVYDPRQLYDTLGAANDEMRAEVVTWLGTIGARFSDMVFYGRSTDVDVLLARGYQADFRQGGLLVGRFVGCPLLIAIAADKPLAHAVYVEFGWAPRAEPVDKLVVKAGKAPTDGHLAVRPVTPLCGNVWYRAALDADDSGGISAGDRWCADALPDGRVDVRADGDRTASACAFRGAK